MRETRNPKPFPINTDELKTSWVTLLKYKLTVSQKVSSTAITQVIVDITWIESRGPALRATPDRVKSKRTLIFKIFKTFSRDEESCNLWPEWKLLLQKKDYRDCTVVIPAVWQNCTSLLPWIAFRRSWQSSWSLRDAWHTWWGGRWRLSHTACLRRSSRTIGHLNHSCTQESMPMTCPHTNLECSEMLQSKWDRMSIGYCTHYIKYRQYLEFVWCTS